MSVGILLVAHDNEVIQYGKLAELNAVLCKRVLPGVKVALITDDQTQFNPIGFDKIIRVDAPTNTPRYYIDKKTSQPGVFRNRTRTNIYDLSPFEETLVIDLDYLVFDPRTLMHLSERPFDVMLNQDVRSVYGCMNPVVKKLDVSSIPQKWATVVYWRRGKIAEKYFKIVKHVETQYEWFAKLYGYSPKLYRNDFAFSIAAHVMNGYSNMNLLVGDLPNSKLLFSWDYDHLVGYHPGGLIIAADLNGKPFPVRTKNQNVHFMNKISLNEHVSGMLAYYGDQA